MKPVVSQHQSLCCALLLATSSSFIVNSLLARIKCPQQTFHLSLSQQVTLTGSYTQPQLDDSQQTKHTHIRKGKGYAVTCPDGHQAQLTSGPSNDPSVLPCLQHSGQ